MGAKCATALEFPHLSFVFIDNRMLKIITSAFIVTKRLEKHSVLKFIFIVTKRLEKHSVLKFIFLKLLGHCNIFTFLVSFFISMTFSVCWLLDQSCLHFFRI